LTSYGALGPWGMHNYSVLAMIPLTSMGGKP
jgi:hypothetical protein